MKRKAALILLIICSGALLSYGAVSKYVRNDKQSDQNAADATIAASSNSDSNKKEDFNQEKILIAYFSLTGNTGKVADILKDKTEGKIFEIEPDFDYSKVKSKKEMEALGQEQVDSGFKPELKNSVTDISSYDFIFIGSPVWWYSVTPPVMSFLSQYNLEGKTVIPFCTCGNIEGDFFTQFKDAIPDAEVLEGLTVTEADFVDEEELDKKIQTWLDELQL